MITDSQPVVDFQGLPLFFCSACGVPVTHQDFFDIGLRFPHPGESRDDYREAELIDTVDHVNCKRVARAG